MTTRIFFCSALVSVALLACTETIIENRPAASADAGTADAEADAAIETPDEDGGADGAASDGKIGTRNDKGTKSVDADISGKGSYTCDGVCTKAGGTCDEEGASNGVGWVDRKYTNGSGSFGNRVSSCDLSESYASGNTTMTSLTCYCDGMPVPPTVRVKKSAGLHSCTKVCSSWALTCSKTRTHYSFANETESSSTAMKDCAAVPAATAHHYTCACDPL